MAPIVRPLQAVQRTWNAAAPAPVVKNNAPGAFWGNWIYLWKIVLIGGLGTMAVWVTIGGLFDIKRLFVRIAESHKQEDQNAN